MKNRPAAANRPTATNPNALDVDGLAVRLLAFALRRAGTRGWRQGDGALAAGKGVEDVVQDAMASLFGGARKWDPMKEPDPWSHLTSFVNSRLSNLRRSFDNKNVEDEPEGDAFSEPGGSPDTPESLLMAKGDAAWMRRARDLLVERIIDDDELVKLHDLAENEDIEKPEIVAKRLGVEVRCVYNMRKRFRVHWHAVVQIVRQEMVRADGDLDGNPETT